MVREFFDMFTGKEACLAGLNVLTVHVSFLQRQKVSSNTCVAAQSTDVPALVMRFCVQQLLNRGTTRPSFPNKVKHKTLAHRQ